MHSQPNAKSPRSRRWSPLTVVALPALLLLALDPRSAVAGSPKSGKSSGADQAKRKSKSEPAPAPRLEVRKTVNQIDGLTVEELDDGTTILRLLGNVEPTFNVYRLSDPDRLVVDVSKSERGKAVPHVPVDSWAVGRVTISSVEEHDSKLARVVVNLKRESSYIVMPSGSELVITITPKEVAPEAYFARKSAGKRQAEIESMKAEAEKQAAELEAAATAKAETAERKASSAETRASSAEERAAAAEQRAREAAEKASEAEEQAAAVRAEADAVKARAEAEAKKLAREAAARAKELEQLAETKAKELEESAEAKAKKLAEAAEAKAKAAEAKAKKLEAAAEAKAKKLEETAEANARKLAAAAEAEARKQAQDALAEAKKLEAEAKKLAEAAELKAKKLEQSAAAKAKEIEDQATANVEKLEREARGTLSEAKKLAEARKAKLEAAEQRASEADRKAKHAEERAAEAKAEAEAAEVYAVRVRAAAEAKAKQAEELLGKAKDAMAEAEEESAQAQQAHEQAKLALGEAKKAARKSGKRDTDQRRELERAVEQAEAAAAAAKQREQQANNRLAELERDHLALEQALAAKQAEASALEAELGTTKTALAEAQESVRAAQKSYEQLGGDEGPSAGDKRAHRKAKTALAKAQTDLAKLEQEATAERAKLAELRDQVAAAGEQLGETLAANEQRRSLQKQWDDERKAAGLSTIRDVRFEDGPKDARVVVELDGPVIYDASSLTPNMTMLELRDVRIPIALERSLDTTSFGGPIDRITSFREGDDVKIVVASAGGEPAGLELDRRANRLIWKFPKQARDGEAKLASRGSGPELELDEPEGPPERTEVVSLGGNKVSGFSTPPVLAARPGTNVGNRGRWRGERIDIELQDAPIKDVLLLFSDIGRVNIIAGPEVQGSVTMKLSAVPWDQALDIILRSLNLGMVQEGNVIRVATQAGLEEERRKAIEEANAQVQLKPLETRLIPLSYATVQDMLPKVQSVLSSRGSVTPDSRTNMLIVMDVAENIALAESLVRQLDMQTPQVLIEARIVEARTNWLRQLGIQWGFDFIASPGTGNPTGLLFPNSIGVAGGSGSNQSPTRGLILPGAAANPNYAIDLPAPVSTGSGGAIGFSFGSLSGNLNTNLRLSAAEDEGEVRIISAPKIVTLDNTEAQIEQGVQIPISQVSAQGVNTRYVNATLGLRVTPHVTNEGAVLLEVQVQKNEADFVNTGARGDPTILTKSAQSQLLITDGDTAVIGGIYTRNQAINRNKVPWFADIPIIGWFFKNKTERDDRSEMLIFLTPRIVNRSTSIGG
ncbi:MAG TPA: type IV pilus secretin PilQ [Enhygromyxa sp.]|nr:type IV pilus secretin PilQ [Enhygromyxa sp.]